MIRFLLAFCLLFLAGCVPPTPTASPLPTPTLLPPVPPPVSEELPATTQQGGMDMLDFASMEIGGVPILLLILALVAITKDWLHVPGKYLRYVSLGLGVLFALLWQQTQGWPGDVNAWIELFVRMLYGLITSGLLDVARSTLGYAGPREGRKAAHDRLNRLGQKPSLSK